MIEDVVSSEKREDVKDILQGLFEEMTGDKLYADEDSGVPPMSDEYEYELACVIEKAIKGSAEKINKMIKDAKEQ